MPEDVRERLHFKQKPTEAEVRELARLLPGGVRDLLSARSRRYAELNLAGRDLTEEELTDWKNSCPDEFAHIPAVKEG